MSIFFFSREIVEEDCEKGSHPSRQSKLGERSTRSYTQALSVRKILSYFCTLALRNETEKPLRSQEH